MWPLSGAAREQLAQSHTIARKLEVWRGGRPYTTLDLDTGSVGMQADRTVVRNVSCVVIDASGRLTGGDIADELDPEASEVVPWRGVLLPSGQPVFVPLGVFGITGRAVTGDGEVSLQGQDRAANYQGAMEGLVAIPAGTPVEVAIQRLLVTRNPTLSMRTYKTGFTCGPLLFQPDIDVWAEALTLAESVGGWLSHDALGRLSLGPALPTQPRPVARYAYGDGLLIDAKRSENLDNINNVVVVNSIATGNGGIISGKAEDTDPRSPTYAKGSRRMVLSITNPYVTSVAQAQTAAAARLAQELGKAEEVSYTIVCDPSREVLDAHTVHFPSEGLVNRGLVTQAQTVPLGPAESMPITARKYLLTPDGQTFDLPKATT
jgi:hypothetical protein